MKKFFSEKEKVIFAHRTWKGYKTISKDPEFYQSTVRKTVQMQEI